VQIIAENDRGYVGLDGNELFVGSKVFDPPKVRLTAPANEDGGGGGVISANISRQAGVVCDGHQQVEIGFARFEQSESVRGQASNPRAEFAVNLNDGSGGGDSSMCKPLAFECDHVTRDSIGVSGTGGSPSRFVSPNGRWWLQIQDDGNFVIYDSADPNHPKATFDLWWLMEALASGGHPYR